MQTIKLEIEKGNYIDQLLVYTIYKNTKVYIGSIMKTNLKYRFTGNGSFLGLATLKELTKLIEKLESREKIGLSQRL